MSDKISASIIRNHSLRTLHAHEADVIENMFEFVVSFRKSAKGFVKNTAVRLARIGQPRLQISPAGDLRNKERIVEIRILLIAVGNSSTFCLENVRRALQKEKTEDVVLVGSSIQAFLAKAVSSAVEVAF